MNPSRPGAFCFRKFLIIGTISLLDIGLSSGDFTKLGFREAGRETYRPV